MFQQQSAPVSELKYWRFLWMYLYVLKLNFEVEFWALGASTSRNKRLNSTSSAAYGISVFRTSKKSVIGWATHADCIRFFFHWFLTMKCSNYALNRKWMCTVHAFMALPMHQIRKTATHSNEWLHCNANRVDCPPQITISIKILDA